jgi:hypothetical protein
LDWNGIAINTTVLALVPLLIAAIGGHLAAKIIDDPKSRRSVIGCFWALFVVGVILTLWQQFRAAQSDLSKDTSDSWMFIVATRSYAPPLPPELAYKIPPPPEALPEVAPFLHFGLDRSDILLNVLATSKTVAKAPQFNSVLWDLDAENPRNPLQIPSQSNPTGYVKRGDLSWGPFSLTTSNAESRVKNGHRIFGFLNVSCPSCAETEVYWVYAVMGQIGWYAEAKKKDGIPSLDGLAKNFDSIKAHPNETWDSILPHTKGKVQISDPG